jgi:CRISPR-associated protein Csy2
MTTKRLLILPHVRIQNANALSSPYTIGFPAMTAWLGAVHALQRYLNERDFDGLKFISSGVVCHDFNLQSYKGRGDFVHSIIGTGNPLDRDGKRPAFIEEARCHLDVTLVIECKGFSMGEADELMPIVTDILNGRMKFAGGDVIGFGTPDLLVVEQGNHQHLRSLVRKLMPGYVLIERRDLMVEAMESGQDALDALLDSISIKHRSEVDEFGVVAWTQQRKQSGWIVPIATGFQGITALAIPGKTLNQRDPDAPHRFAETIVTLGEFVMPYRLDGVEHMLWKYQHDESNNLYLCQQL